MAHEGVAKYASVGHVCLEISNIPKLAPKHVKHVSNIWLNLLFVGKLCDENYDNLKLTKGSIVVAKGTKHSILFLTETKIY